jgi:hypothetical protein
MYMTLCGAEEKFGMMERVKRGRFWMAIYHIESYNECAGSFASYSCLNLPTSRNIKPDFILMY